jgi:hypothetical protein
LADTVHEPVTQGYPLPASANNSLLRLDVCVGVSQTGKAPSKLPLIHFLQSLFAFGHKCECVFKPTSPKKADTMALNSKLPPLRPSRRPGDEESVLPLIADSLNREGSFGSQAASRLDQRNPPQESSEELSYSWQCVIDEVL